MKPAFQKDEALLTDIEQARDQGATKVWWLGQSGFLVVTPAGTILFDPYLSDSLTQKYAGSDKPHVRVTEQVIAPERLSGIDVITSSHNHTDHLDAETLLPLFDANPQARLLCPRANRDFILKRLGDEVADRLVTTNAGETVELPGMTFHGMTAAHNALERDEAGNCKFMGFVAELAGKTFYHSGDTLLHEGLADSLKPFAPDVAFLPINGNKPERRVAGNLNGEEAAALAKEIDAKLVIPHHFDMFAFNTAAPASFEDACQEKGQACQTLRNGEGFAI
jgi:L-ascorbate metabolism protein UlaG (beta-lactamase superfamily)